MSNEQKARINELISEANGYVRFLAEIQTFIMEVKYILNGEWDNANAKDKAIKYLENYKPNYNPENYSYLFPKEKETPSSEIDATIEGLSHLLQSRCYSIYRLEQTLIKSFDDKQERICREIHRYKNEYNTYLKNIYLLLAKRMAGNPNPAIFYIIFENSFLSLTIIFFSKRDM